jgi:hypothetical protein
MQRSDSLRPVAQAEGGIIAADCWPLAAEPRTARNWLGHQLGADLADWAPPALPPYTPMIGAHCRLEPVR